MNSPEKRFNLLDEGWIRVQTQDCSIREVSLIEALCHAHSFVGLAGETPTQDFAILRVLLAVLHTVFGRTDCAGKESPINTHETVLKRWAELWGGKHLPEVPIRSYLESQHDKFWLFHPTRPFWQVPSASNGTYYSSAKLNGTMLESENKRRLFVPRLNQAQTGLHFAEAARWLVHVNAYDDTSAKPKGKNLPSSGAGYLGKIGAIYAKGENLFETLMLNLILLKDGEEVWPENHPSWELDTAKADERTEIAVPDNPAQLLTLQSRRLLLDAEGDRVIGFYLLGGDFFDRKNAFTEQMTIWRAVYDKKRTSIEFFQPKQHEPSRQLWRDFSAILSKDEARRRPGMIRWLELLKYNGLLQTGNTIHLSTAGVLFGDKDFFVSDIFGDTIAIHSGLLSELSTPWKQAIETEVSRCDSIAYEIGRLAKNLAIAASGVEGRSTSEAQTQFYDRIDVPFRRWLRSLDPENADIEMEQAVLRWQSDLKGIALKLANELVDRAGPTVFVGRDVRISEDKTAHYSAPEAFNGFLYGLKKNDL